MVDGGQPVDLRRLTEDLYARGVGRLMVEGGGTMHTQFLTAGLADELHLVVAPFFVGDSRARRFVSDGAVPVEPRPPGDAGRGAPDRRRGAAAVRAVGPVRRPAELRRSMYDAPPSRPRSAPRCRCRCGSPTATPRPRACSPSTAWSTAGSTSRSASATGPGARRGAPAAGAAGAPAQRVPDRRRVRQPALRLRPAAARGGRAHRRRRRVPALPAPGGPRHRPVRQARRVRAAGRRPGHLRGEPGPRATARTSGTTPWPRRCCAPSACDRVALLSNNPDKAEQLDRLGVDGDRAGADRGAPVRRPTPATWPPRPATPRTPSTCRSWGASRGVRVRRGPASVACQGIPARVPRRRASTARRRSRSRIRPVP